MIHKKFLGLMTLFFHAYILSACMNNASITETIPTELPSLLSCGEEVFSREDEESVMEMYFEYINLYDAEAGGSFEKDNSNVFLVKSDQYIGISYKSTFPNHLRLCVQEYDEEGKVVFDKTVNTDGGGSWVLQPFEPGSYVFRLIVKNIVIKSFVINVSD